MTRFIKISLVMLVFLLSNFMFAQQDPQYTQYMYNMNVVNPAYAGSKESLSLTGLYRKQWSGLEGAPETFTLSLHSPVGEKVGLGFSAIKDEIGPVKETNAFADFSYTLDLGANLKLALGVKAGVTFHDVGLTDLDLIHPGDPFFSENIDSNYFNAGAGAFLYADNFYVGLSVPNMIKSVHLDENGLKYGSQEMHYFATAGYIFDINPNFKLKPSVMVKSTFDAPVSFDANINALFFEKFEIGGSYRLDDSFSGVVGFQVTPMMRVGYAYDHVVSDLKALGSASHEVILTFDLYFAKKVLRSPRFF